MKTTIDVDIAIIGTGFAGLGAAARLKELGTHSFVLFERASEVGGTWRDNVYPGCACDIPSPLYSLSFAPNPAWSRKFSPQPEILDYLKKVVERYDLRSAIRFNTEIIRTEFITSTGCWTLTDQAGNQTTARVILIATGPLNLPSIPTLPCLDTFSGRSFPTANWDHTYDLTGKRVAIVGTGASAIQVIPRLAPLVDQLTIFQRTAPYVAPRRDRAMLPIEQRLFRHVPILQHAYREFIYWLNEIKGLSFLGNATVNKLASTLARKHLEASIIDPELRQKATPDYTIGCKRVLLSDDYYPTLTRPNVELVTAGIAAVTPDALVDKNGTVYPVDAIVFATGFVVAGMLNRLMILGRYGQNLYDQWLKTGPEAHLGLTVSGYPNLLLLVGPNTGLGHNSIVHMIESQMNYVLDYLKRLDNVEPGAFLDLRPDMQQAYNAQLQQKLTRTVWASGCQSWYLDAGGKNSTIWPALATAYRKATRRVNPAEYVVVQPEPLGAALDKS